MELGETRTRKLATPHDYSPPPASTPPPHLYMYLYRLTDLQFISDLSFDGVDNVKDYTGLLICSYNLSFLLKNRFFFQKVRIFWGQFLPPKIVINRANFSRSQVLFLSALTK